MTAIERPRANRVVVGLFIVAVLLNLGLLALAHWPATKRLIGDEAYYTNLASAIAAGQPAQHDPLWPPLYGELLAVLLRASGSLLVIQLVQVVFWLVAAYCLWRIVQRLVPPAATLALALFLFSPELMAFSHYFWPETLHLLLMLAALWLLVCHAANRWLAALAGALAGLALLTKSLLWPALALLILFTALVKVEGTTARTRLGSALLVGVLAVATVAGATRLAEANGRPWPLAGSVVFNLWLGLTDTGAVDYQDARVGQEYRRFVAAGPDAAARNAVYLKRISDRVRQQGLWQTLLAQAGRQYARLFGHQTFFTTQLPGGPRQAYAFSAPVLTRALVLYSSLYHAVLLAAGALGLAFVRARPFGWLHFLLLFIVYNLALFLALHAVTRYTVQFMPAWIVFAAAGLVSVMGWLRRRQATSAPGFVVTAPRTIGGAGLALALLALAFRSLLMPIS
jgi:hypothetical protein